MADTVGTSPKQQRGPLPSLLSLSFFFAPLPPLQAEEGGAEGEGVGGGLHPGGAGQPLHHTVHSCLPTQQGDHPRQDSNFLPKYLKKNSLTVNVENVRIDMIRICSICVQYIIIFTKQGSLT